MSAKYLLLVLLLAGYATAALYTAAGGDSDDHDASLWIVNTDTGSLDLHYLNSGKEAADDLGPFTICYDPLNDRMLQFQHGYDFDVKKNGSEHLFAITLGTPATRTEMSFAHNLNMTEGVFACVFDPIEDHFVLILEGSGVDRGGNGTLTLAYMSEVAPDTYSIEYIGRIGGNGFGTAIGDGRGVYIDFDTDEIIIIDTSRDGRGYERANPLGNPTRIFDVHVNDTTRAAHGVAVHPATKDIYVVDDDNPFPATPEDVGRSLAVFLNINTTKDPEVWNFRYIGAMVPSNDSAANRLACHDFPCTDFNAVSLAFDESPFTSASLSGPSTHDGEPYTVTITWGVINPKSFSISDLNVAGGAASGLTSTGAKTFEVTITPTSALDDVTVSIAANTPQTVQHSGDSVTSVKTVVPLTELSFSGASRFLRRVGSFLFSFRHRFKILVRVVGLKRAVEEAHVAGLTASDLIVTNGKVVGIEERSATECIVTIEADCDGVCSVSPTGLFTGAGIEVQVGTCLLSQTEASRITATVQVQTS